MANVGFATLSVIPSLNGFQSKLERGTSGALGAVGTRGGVLFGDAAGKSAGSRFGRVFSTAAKASLIGLAGAGALAVKFGGDAVSAASDQTESVNAVNVAYGKQARAVQKLGKQSAKSLALPRTEFNELAVRFSNFANTIAGGNGKKTVKALDNLTKRGADFASVYNIDVAEAATLFQSGLAGETEPLRRFGIDMSAATVEAFAFSHGIAEQGAKLTEAQKVQARYQILMQQTAKTQGDLVNTSGSLANQQRFLNASWEDAKAKLGKALLPIVQDFTGFLLKKGIPALEDFSDWFSEEGGPKLEDFATRTKERVLPILADLRDLAKKAAHFGGDMVDAFNDLPDWAKKALLGGGVGAIAAKKTGLLKVAFGDNGLFSKGGSPARPLYVWTVNGGAGGGLPGGGAGGAGGAGGPKSLLLRAGTVTLQGAVITAAVIAVAKGIQIEKGQAPGIGTSFITGPHVTGGQSDADKLGDPNFFSDKLNRELEAQARGVDKVRTTWIHTKEAAEDYSKYVQQRVPREIRTTVTGWDVANRDARNYLATLLEIRGIHVDTRLDRAGGSGTTPGSGVTPPTPHGRPHDRGINITVEKVEAQDVNHLLRDLQGRAHRASLDGLR